jgi:predicted CoA-substrate-specific enzyme activase
MSAPVFVGIDVGSSATKCVVVDNRSSILGSHVVASGFDYAVSVNAALDQALRDAGASRGDIATCVSTGYGRQRVDIADRCVTEITCHARGAREWCPDVRTIIDIGGQDTKVIRLNGKGQMTDYRMNAKCAAGTGTFLESIAAKLGVPLAEIDALAMTSNCSTVVNSYCTVFAGTEVIERIKEGQRKEDISMGLFRSIASRVREMMPAYDGVIGATGGVVSHCRAMVRALEEALGVEIHLPPMPQFAGAYGAALLAVNGSLHQTRETGHVARG